MVLLFKPIKKKERTSVSPSRKQSQHSAKAKPRKKAVKVKSTTKSPDASPLAHKKEVTMFDPAAQENLYYVAHTAADALQLRGFGWPDAPKKKKKKSGKKKK